MKWSDDPSVKNALRGVPDYMREGIVNYIERGLPPGDFLHAVLCDRLVESFGRADEHNRRCMWEWCDLMCNFVPSNARGSEEKVQEWIRGFEEQLL